MHSEWHLYIGKISVPPLQKSCATLAKQQAMATNESADTKIYGRVCLFFFAGIISKPIGSKRQIPICQPEKRRFSGSTCGIVIR